MQCDQVRELLEAYALDALDAGERAQVEAHLATCAECQQIANEYIGIASQMPQALASASTLQLPASLKQRVIQSLSGEKPTPIRPRFAWLLQWRTLGVAATLVLLMAALLWALQLNTALAQERALRAEFANLVSQQETVLEVIDSPKTIKALLRSPNNAPAYGKLYSRPDLPNVVVMAARLPPPPDGQAYQLWLTEQGHVQLAGSLKINNQGFGLIIFDAQHNGPDYEAARLVLQPEGSSQPDGTLILTWDATK
jgi:anti-sigma-K factor RskA/putative zinc finger protein